MSISMRLSLIVSLWMLLMLLALGHHHHYDHYDYDRYSVHRPSHTHHHTHYTLIHALRVQHRSANFSKILSEWYFFNSPKYSYGNESFNISGEVTISRPDPKGCTMDDTVRGKIVITEQFFCSTATKIDACQKVGCLGLIEHNEVFQVAGYFMWGVFDASFSRGQLYAPCVDISPDNGEFLKKLVNTPNSVIIAVISSEDPNPYGEFYHSRTFLFLRIFFYVGALIPLLAAVHRLVIWHRSLQRLATVSWLVLILELIGNLERLLYTGISLNLITLFSLCVSVLVFLTNLSLCL